ncbi:uncharacterized protein Z519_07677 [Cladophialophora bantiana CBS 173.52]|uniref:Major facilitator superfamily (MFS) profile domain-containing protein n=1 Tax=Cladophialophora bantiana (strain ATCC 10958 / CBS 173.52 / CDC B-1940 / NIH 8579) TaxID=1442370 RepID=A0A0D2I491_CLAB1|nr:uncharacterized protein Z519_07677 [Cladophialophora bantiana CBS 173.52]KIW91709.1 hypothetical protein Z519_07677 [Cladophialophora bantiana CBS 173.52]
MRHHNVNKNVEDLSAMTPQSSWHSSEKTPRTPIADEGEHSRQQEPSRQLGFVPPNGGFEAWLLVFAGFLVFANVWGIVSTFGAFQAFYIRDLLSTESASAISWIGSVQAFLVVFTGVFGGPLFDRGYLRSLVFTGCFLTVFGMMMTSLAKSYYQVFLAQGICVGLGAGLSYVPTLALISTYFTTKRPIAIGIAAVGSSVGGVIFPIMFRRLQPQIGYGWTVRCIGFINLAFAVFICLILGRHRKDGGGQARPLWDLTALREPIFLLWTASLFFLFLAYYIPLFFIVSWARWELDTSEDMAFYMLAILNGGSFLGRTFPYLLGQRVKPVYTLIFSAILGTVLIFSWIAIHSSVAFIVWCVLWGFVAGVLVTAPTSTMPHPVISPDMSVIGTRMGMSWSAAAVGSIIGSPIAGALANVASGDFLHAQIFVGAVMAAGAICLIPPLLAIEKHDHKSKS